MPRKNDVRVHVVVSDGYDDVCDVYKNISRKDLTIKCVAADTAR